MESWALRRIRYHAEFYSPIFLKFMKKLRNALWKRDWMVSLEDIQEAYPHIPIHPSYYLSTVCSLRAEVSVRCSTIRHIQNSMVVHQDHHHWVCPSIVGKTKRPHRQIPIGQPGQVTVQEKLPYPTINSHGLPGFPRQVRVRTHSRSSHIKDATVQGKGSTQERLTWQ